MEKSNGKADKCTREMMGYSALCALQPKSKISQCLKEASQYYTSCVSGNGHTGVSSGCSTNDTFLGASRYNKSGRAWNGKCYAYYTNREIAYYQDSNGNYCDNNGVCFSQMGDN